MSEPRPFVAGVIGGVLIFLAGVYAWVPANTLPRFVPGYDPALTTLHVKHGLASLVMGVALWAYAWFASRAEAPE